MCTFSAWLPETPATLRSFAVADAEDLKAYGDATFDIVTCNCGLMFMPQYER
jgi:ubiquinone/menaquinone biosynthesis C-methylase UbiE